MSRTTYVNIRESGEHPSSDQRLSSPRISVTVPVPIHPLPIQIIETTQEERKKMSSSSSIIPLDENLLKSPLIKD